VSTTPATPAPQGADAGSSSDAAYREIKSWILLGEIPLGMRLAEERVAARLQMSRTPVREALLRLFAERFVERHAGGGYRVNHPTARAMLELYDVRKALELFAIRQTLTRPAAQATAALRTLRDDWQAIRADAPSSADPNFVLLDEDFHERLAGACGNRELLDALGRVCERIRPVRTHDFLSCGRIDATIAQHCELVETALAGSASAHDLLERHICESQEYVEGAVGRALERMLTTPEAALGW
jgi:DNA-binding GntR family transcriptional regulator